MRKALNKIKGKWKVLLITIVAVVAICSFIDWIWDTYGQDYALTWVALFIAVIVAIVALWSLKTTRDSLKLTRATTRPFVNITGGIYEGGLQRMQLRIENTGLLPADDMLLELETIEPKNIASGSVSLMDISISIFPNEYKTEIIELNAKLSAAINSGAELKVLGKITYYFAGEPHHTNRVLHLPPSKSGRKAKEQLDFLSEGNYWD